MVLLTLARPTVSLAQREAALRWRSAPGCPGEMAARALWRRAPRDAVAEVVLEVDRAGASATVRVLGAGPAIVRRFRSPSCAAVADAALVVLALAVRSGRSSAAGAADPRRWNAAVAVGARVDRGRLPGFAAAAEVAGALGWGRWRAELSAAWWPSVHVAVDGDRGASFRLWTSTASGCHRPLARVWTCVGAEAGRLSARGQGVREPLSPRSTWFAATGTVAVDALTWSRMAVVIRAASSLPLRRRRYGFRDEETIFQPRRATFGVGLALAVRF